MKSVTPNTGESKSPDKEENTEGSTFPWGKILLVLGAVSLLILMGRACSGPAKETIEKSQQTTVEAPQPRGPQVVDKVTWPIGKELQITLEAGQSLRVKPGQTIHTTWGWFDPRDGSHCDFDRDGECDQGQGKKATYVADHVKSEVPFPNDLWMAIIFKDGSPVLNVPQNQLNHYQGDVILEIIE